MTLHFFCVLNFFLKIDLPTLPIFRQKGQTNPYLFSPDVTIKSSSLCQRLGLTRSVRNKPRVRSASIEHRRRESPPEAKDEWSESFARGARGFVAHHEGANTIFLTNKKLSLDKGLKIFLHLITMKSKSTTQIFLHLQTMKSKAQHKRQYIKSHLYLLAIS